DLVREHKLLLEAVKYGRISSQFRTDHFKRNSAIHFAIPRAVNRSHASFPKNLQDFVSPPQYGAGPQEGLVVRVGRVTRSRTGRECSFRNSRSIRNEFEKSRGRIRRETV